MRLDVYLVTKGFFSSRNKAQEEIRAGNIEVDDKIIIKPNYDVEEPKIKVLGACPYVSRGGYKLETAIKSFNLDFKDKIVLDIGASTGGFTDCSLQFGAKLVYSVDVGSDQLAQPLRNNPRVISMENTNILDTNIEDNIDILVCDVSFVSIKHIIPGIKRYLNQNNYLIILIKPQFEAGKMINKGVIKDKKIHLNILKNVNNYLNQEGLFIERIIPSSIKGGSGNIEFLALVKNSIGPSIDFSKVVDEAHRRG